LDDFEIVQLLVKMTGKEQNGIFQFALAIIQGAFSKIQNGDCGADYNRRDQQDATKDKPIQGIAPIKRRSTAIADAAPSGRFLPHWPLPGGYGYNA
jgi:hypothetical protein